MSELFDKEVNAQKESLKNFRGSHKLHKNMKVETKKKRRAPKIFLMEGRKEGRSL